MGSDERRFMTKLCICIVVFFLITGEVFAGGYEIKRKVGEYEADVTLDRNPPVVGDNPIEIEIKDASGQNVSDATVLVNYYMPPMPRMTPMNYKIEAQQKGVEYKATLNFIMAGPWYIAIIIKREGKAYRTRFNVDAQ
jgi:hypothetical protein